MSSIDQPVDAQLIEQTKRQIQSLVAEIAELSKRNVTPGEFYGQFLNRVVSALAAIGGAVWTTNDQGQLALQYQVNLQQTNLPNDEDAQRRHSRLLYKAMAQGQGMVVPPHSGFGEGGDGTRRPIRPSFCWSSARCGPTWKRSAWWRFSSGPRPRRTSSRATCGSYCRCASWPATSSRVTSCGISRTGRSSGRGWRSLPGRARLAGADPDGLHDRQRGPPPDRVRPGQRGHPPRQSLHDRGGQRAGRFRQAIEHRAAVGQAGHGGGGHRRPGRGTRATPATWPRRSRTPSRNTSTRPIRR